MEYKIIICGLNGAGKSTLGKALAEKLGWKFMDIEAYYFPENNVDYSAAAARTKAEVTKLLCEDLQKYENFVLAAVKGNFGETVMSMFTGIYQCTEGNSDGASTEPILPEVWK